MPSQLKQLRLSRRGGNFNLVDSSIKRKIRKSSRRTKSLSPTDEDIDRIIEDYIDEDYKRSIINIKTSELAVDSLEDGNAIRGRAEDFSNFISSVGKSRIAERLRELYMDENILNLLNQELVLKTKTIKGFALNKKIYIRQTKAGLRAYRFKDNTFAKLPKNLFRI